MIRLQSMGRQMSRVLEVVGGVGSWCCKRGPCVFSIPLRGRDRLNLWPEQLAGGSRASTIRTTVFLLCLLHALTPPPPPSPALKLFSVLLELRLRPQFHHGLFPEHVDQGTQLHHDHPGTPLILHSSSPSPRGLRVSRSILRGTCTRPPDAVASR